jgi:hypothetical protein
MTIQKIELVSAPATSTRWDQGEYLSPNGLGCRHTRHVVLVSLKALGNL